MKRGAGTASAAKPMRSIWKVSSLPPALEKSISQRRFNCNGLPRVKRSTQGEGHERRYFYGTVWAMCLAQPALWLMWYVVPRTRTGDVIKLVIFVSIIAFVGNLARLGRLPRTRPIVPGELAVSD